MARRRRAEIRKIQPDAVYNNALIAKFINCLMYSGQKSKSEAIFYDSISASKEKLGESEVEIFTQVLNNVRPQLEVKSRRIGGATYQVPVEVRPDRQNALAIRWLINASRGRSGRSMVEKLTNEFVDAYNNTGAAVRKKEEVHRMAEGNKAFAHYRW